MPAPDPKAARPGPTLLLLAGGDDPAGLIAWLGQARGAMAVTVAMRPCDAYVPLRRACARLHIPFIPLADAADAAALLRARRWDCIEVAGPWFEPELQAGLAATPALKVLATDDPALPPEAITPFDLVLCGSDGVAQALAQAMARTGPGIGSLRVPPSGDQAAATAWRLATIRAGLAEQAARAARPRARLALLQVVAGPRAGPGDGAARIAATVCRAVRLVDPAISCRMASTIDRDGAIHLLGDPAEPDSFDPAALDAVLDAATVVHVHDCLTRFGLFVAARARMRGCRVIGSDHGGGAAPFLAAQPHVARLFHLIQTHSAAGDIAALNLPVRTIRLPGPVDEEAFPLAPDAARDPTLVLTLGPTPPLRLAAADRQHDPARDLMARAGLCVPASGLDQEDQLRATLEALCTGTPVAGAPDELAGLPGCHVVAPGQDLATLLRRHAEGTLPHPPGHAIREGVVRAYGLRQFGTRYLAMVEGLACAS